VDRVDDAHEAAVSLCSSWLVVAVCWVSLEQRHLGLQDCRDCGSMCTWQLTSFASCTAEPSLNPPHLRPPACLPATPPRRSPPWSGQAASWGGRSA
jgi:hypothetical protein